VLNLFLPPTVFLSGNQGVRVVDANQFGEVTGMGDDGEVKTLTDVPYKVYFRYYMMDHGDYDIKAVLLNSEDVDSYTSKDEARLNSMNESNRFTTKNTKKPRVHEQGRDSDKPKEFSAGGGRWKLVSDGDKTPIHKQGKDVREGVEEHEKFSDHTKQHYHKILAERGWEHQNTSHKQNGFSKDPKHDYTEHVYTHPQHPGSSVTITQEHSTIRNEKPTHWRHFYMQSNGIRAPSVGDSRPQLIKTLDRNYGDKKLDEESRSARGKAIMGAMQMGRSIKNVDPKTGTEYRMKRAIEKANAARAQASARSQEVDSAVKSALSKKEEEDKAKAASAPKREVGNDDMFLHHLSSYAAHGNEDDLKKAHAYARAGYVHRKNWASTADPGKHGYYGIERMHAHAENTYNDQVKRIDSVKRKVNPGPLRRAASKIKDFFSEENLTEEDLAYIEEKYGIDTARAIANVTGISKKDETGHGRSRRERLSDLVGGTAFNAVGTGAVTGFATGNPVAGFAGAALGAAVHSASEVAAARKSIKHNDNYEKRMKDYISAADKKRA
jgi:hypothetical protein